MKRLKTESLTGVLKAPYAKVEVDHIQNGLLEQLKALVLSLVGTYTTDDLIVLYGVVQTLSNSDLTLTWTDGAIYYNGEIYFVPAGNITKVSGTFVFKIVDTSVQSKFSDGALHEWMQTRNISLQLGATGTGIADFDEATVKYGLATIPSVIYRDDVGAESIVTILHKKIDLGVWNMDTTVGLTIETDIVDLYSRLLSCDTWIINDSETEKTNLTKSGDFAIDTSNPSRMLVLRDGGGNYDNSGFDRSDMNRGYMYITYIG